MTKKIMPQSNPSRSGKGKGLQGRMQDIGFEFADQNGEFPAEPENGDTQSTESPASATKPPPSRKSLP